MSNPIRIGQFFLALVREIIRSAEMGPGDDEGRLQVLYELPEFQTNISEAGLRTAFAVTIGMTVSDLTEMETHIASLDRRILPAVFAARIALMAPHPRETEGAMQFGTVLARFLAASIAIARMEREPPVHPPRLVVLAIKASRDQVDGDEGPFASSGADRRKRLKALCDAARSAYA